MKKMLVIILAVLLLFGGFLYWNGSKAPETPAVQTTAAQTSAVQTTAAPDAQSADSPAEAAPAETEATAAPVEIRRLDLEAIRALHDADETVMSLADERVSWREFSELLCATGKDIESYFEQMAAYYGMAADWDGSVGDGSGMSFAQYAVAETRDYLASSLTIRAFAAEQGIALDGEEEASLAPEALAREALGEEGTVEQFREALETQGLSLETYRSMRETSLLYSRIAEQLYGLEGEVPDEEFVSIMKRYINIIY